MDFRAQICGQTQRKNFPITRSFSTQHLMIYSRYENLGLLACYVVGLLVNTVVAYYYYYYYYYYY